MKYKVENYRSLTFWVPWTSCHCDVWPVIQYNWNREVNKWRS